MESILVWGYVINGVWLSQNMHFPAIFGLFVTRLTFLVLWPPKNTDYRGHQILFIAVYSDGSQRG